jgi:predicted alpha/beta superfamily hydrolase
MGVLKGIGYTLAAILVLAVLLIGGALISALVAASGAILLGAAVIAMIALCIKEYCEHESVPTSPSKGEERRTQESS